MHGFPRTTGVRRPWRVALQLAGLVCAAVVMAVAVGVFFLNRPTANSRIREVRIEPGMGARRIGEVLEADGLVRSGYLFALLVRLQGLEEHLEAGTYRLDGHRSTAQIIPILLKAPLRTRRITIPEGLTHYEIAALLERAGVADSARFVHLAESEVLAKELGIDGPDLEGFLFPETYFLDEESTEEAIIRRMVHEFDVVFADSLRARLDSVGLTLRQAVILASIVEKEAKVDTERPVIAGVFLRRLALNRRLESCATVEYALGEHRSRLTRADLRIDSPYNTYRHRGLPPGPIGNPGRAALLAVLHPAHTDFLYFVARGDGTHVFSRTNREHERAKRALRHLRSRK